MISHAAQGLFLQEAFPISELVRSPSWNQGGNNDQELGMVQDEPDFCPNGLMGKESAIHELIEGFGAWLSAAWLERPPSLYEHWSLPLWA